MNILKKTSKPEKFEWFNFDDYASSKAERVEIYFAEDSQESDLRNEDYDKYKKRIVSFFEYLTKGHKDDLAIGQDHPKATWGGLTLDTWKIKGEDFVVNLDHLSRETKRYLAILEASAIELNYIGFCTCEDWSYFLDTILDCVLKNIAPYSPLIFDKRLEAIIYFDNSFSLGIYTQKKIVEEEVNKIAQVFDVKLVKHV